MGDWILFFLVGWGAPFTVYVVLSVFAACRLRGARRVLALLPAPVMLVVVVWTLWAYVQESNLWPIGLIFASPVAALWVAVTLLIGWMAGRRASASDRG